MLRLIKEGKVFTPAEKLTWKSIYDQITASYHRIRAKALSYELDVSELDEAYQAFHDFFMVDPGVLDPKRWDLLFRVDQQIARQLRDNYLKVEAELLNKINAIDIEAAKKEAEENAKNAIPELAPRYRGMASAPDAGNTGFISTNQGSNLQMNRGDWVLYNGSQQGIWAFGFMYRWTGFGWQQVLPNESELYAAGILDITEGAPTSVAFISWVRYLFAAEATITNLKATNLFLEHYGTFQSRNWGGVNGDTGFLIDGDSGDVWFNNGTFRGRVEMNEGYVKGSIFAQSLEAGPLSVSPLTPAPVTKSFPANSTGQDIYNSIGEGNFTATGSYGGQNISRIETVMEYNNTRFYYSVYVTISGNRTRVAQSTSLYPFTSVTHNQRLSSQLTVTITISGKTMKFNDLPEFQPGERNTVYRVPSNITGQDGNFIVHVKG